MPELPEVEAVCRKLRPDAVGARIRSARFLHRPNRRVQRAVPGRCIQEIRRRAKNILIHLDNERTLRVHLRMTGNLFVIPDARLYSSTVRVVFTFDDCRSMVLDDPRALGVIDLLTPQQLDVLERETGPEPLSPAFTAEWFIARARRTVRPAKLYLMDQSRVAGLGNIYAAEALHRARVHPAKPMNQLSKPKLARLHAAIVTTLRDGVESACSAYSGPGRYNSTETFPVAVYGREGESCHTCGCRIRRIVQGGRSSYYCPGCQRR